MTDRISLRCPQCSVKLKASYRLVGSTCKCPKCRFAVVVRIPIPSDADIHLVGEAERTDRRPTFGQAIGSWARG